MAGFYACYLLTPIDPEHHMKISYVGFTVCPSRRLRQHNGELASGGAKYTRKFRPWDMAIVVHGFPSDTQALQFEYAWQRAHKSRSTKQIVQKYLKGKRGLGRAGAVPRKIAQLMLMLRTSPWIQLPLSIVYTKPEYRELAETFVSPLIDSGEIGFLPDHMQSSLCSIQDLPVGENIEEDEQFENASCVEFCIICDRELTLGGLEIVRCYHQCCVEATHVTCMSFHFLESSGAVFDFEDPEFTSEKLIPSTGDCPHCSQELKWSLLLSGKKSSIR